MDDMRGLQQQQDRRLKLPQPAENQQPPQQPQKCPRCESLNTKFCYYNNYSLSQPRYFCKSCRRYWTQGGTLRNVPVGGGCRKGKRSKKPSPADNDPQNRHPQQQDQQQQLLQLQQPYSTTTSTTTVSAISTTTSPTTDNTAIASASTVPSVFYPGGGFLSSLGAFQQFNQPMNVVGGDFGGSNLALLQGFGLPSFNPHQQQPQHQQQLQQSQLFHVGTRDKAIHQLFPSEEDAIQPSNPSSSHQEWHQSFINPSNPSASTEAGFWSSHSNNTNINGGGASLISTQWPDLPGYGPSSPHPPPSSSSPSFL